MSLVLYTCVGCPLEHLLVLYTLVKNFETHKTSICTPKLPYSYLSDNPTCIKNIGHFQVHITLVYAGILGEIYQELLEKFDIV